MNWVSVINRTFFRTSKDNLILIICLKSKSKVCTFNPQNKSDAARKETTPRAFVPTVPSFLPRQQYSQLRSLAKRQSTLQTVWDNSQAAKNTTDQEIDRNTFWIKSLKSELRTFQLMGFKQRAAKNWFICFIQPFTTITFIIITFLKTEYRLLGSFLIIQMKTKILDVRKTGNETLLRYITSTTVQQHRGGKKLTSFKSKQGELSGLWR